MVNPKIILSLRECIIIIKSGTEEYLAGCLRKYPAGDINFWYIWEGKDGTERSQLWKGKNYELKKIIRVDDTRNVKFQKQIFYYLTASAKLYKQRTFSFLNVYLGKHCIKDVSTKVLLIFVQDGKTWKELNFAPVHILHIRWVIIFYNKSILFILQFLKDLHTVTVCVFGNPATCIHIRPCILLRWEENGPYCTNPEQTLCLCKVSYWPTHGVLTWKIFKLLLSVTFETTGCQDYHPLSISGRTVGIPTAQRTPKMFDKTNMFCQCLQ